MPRLRYTPSPDLAARAETHRQIANDYAAREADLWDCVTDCHLPHDGPVADCSRHFGRRSVRHRVACILLGEANIRAGH